MDLNYKLSSTPAFLQRLTCQSLQSDTRRERQKNFLGQQMSGIKTITILYSSLFIICMSRNTDEKTIVLLNSTDKEEVISGAYKACETGNGKFVPYLLKDAYDERRSTNIRFKGITVYQAKMVALKKIFKQEPPEKITYKLDSIAINFIQNFLITKATQ
jgi:hypothetical protein